MSSRDRRAAALPVLTILSNEKKRQIEEYLQTNPSVLNQFVQKQSIFPLPYIPTNLLQVEGLTHLWELYASNLISIVIDQLKVTMVYDVHLFGSHPITLYIIDGQQNYIPIYENVTLGYITIYITGIEDYKSKIAEYKKITMSLVSSNPDRENLIIYTVSVYVLKTHPIPFLYLENKGEIPPPLTFVADIYLYSTTFPITSEISFK